MPPPPLLGTWDQEGAGYITTLALDNFYTIHKWYNTNRTHMEFIKGMILVFTRPHLVAGTTWCDTWT